MNELKVSFERLVGRMAAFHATGDGAERHWTFCWRDRRGRWFRTWSAFAGGVYRVVRTGESWLNDTWAWDVKPGEFSRLATGCGISIRAVPCVEEVEDMNRWLDDVEKDWTRVCRKVEKGWPNSRRNGSVPRAVVERYVPTFPRQGALAGEAVVRKFVSLVQGRYYRPSSCEPYRFYREQMTAGDYLDLVGIGLAATVDAERRKDAQMSGEDYYRMNGYCRSGGTILSLPRDSPEAFRKWIREEEPYGRHDGGHQFWIGPGRIHLGVSLRKPDGREGEAYKVTLHASFAWTAYNLARMAVAYYERGIPVELVDAEQIRKALLAEDDLAIVAAGGETRYASRNGCFESIHLSSIGSRYALVRDFVRWDRLPILRPTVCGEAMVDRDVVRADLPSA